MTPRLPSSLPPQIAFPTIIDPPCGKVAVLSPHPDDEVIGPGGCVAIHRLRGEPVRALVVTDGRAGNTNPERAAAEYVATRRAECKAAAEVLGGVDLTFWDFPDSCEITEEAINEAAARAAQWLRLDPPDVVYAPCPMDAHSDHAAVAEIAKRALKKISYRGTVFGFEVWGTPAVDTVVDISAVFETKIRAVRCFPSQLAENPLDHFVAGLNAARALFLPKGGRYAEGFVTCRHG